MNTSSVIALGSDEALSRRLVGDEIAVVAKLRRLGFPVPDGFCVLQSSLHQQKQLSDLIDAAHPLFVSATRFSLTPSYLHEPRTWNYEETGSDSEAIEVDAAALVDTVIAGFSAYLSANKEPLRSLLQNVSRKPAAILVQPSIATEFSGIAFSTNPITGAEETILQVCCRTNGSEIFAGFAINRNGQVTELGETRSKYSISLEQLRQIAGVCRRAETALGQQCELDWKLEGEAVWITRAQPLRETGKVSPEDSWTRANIGEVVPERMTPLSYSAWKRPMELLFRCSFRFFRVPEERFQFVKNEDGKLWYNIGAINYLSGLLGMPGIDLAIGNGRPEARSFSSGLRIGPMIRHSVGLLRTSLRHAKVGRDVAKASSHLKSIAQKYSDLSGVSSSAECLELATKCYAEVEKTIHVYADTTSASFSSLALLEFAASKWLSPDFSLVPLLSSEGVSITGSTELLRRLRLDPDNPLLIKEFEEQYGHRGWQEVEFMSPTWREMGSLLWRHADSPVRPNRSQPNSGNSLQVEPNEVPVALKGWKRAVFSGLIERVNVLAVFRENIKHEFFRPIDSIRRLLRMAAEILVNERKITEENDIYFLNLHQLKLLTSGKHVFELRNLASIFREISEKRAENEIYRSIGNSPANTYVWQGFGASHGHITGRARVLRSPEEISRVQPGDILVAEVLDAGWFPLFSVVAGIVTSLGGVLSHPCIVAREYGIPAVVGIEGITKSIQDGSWITIDGELGTVETILAVESLSA